MAKKQSQVKQIWFDTEDEENFARAAQILAEQGYDVSPDNKRAVSPYSHTKVIRLIMRGFVKELK